MQEKKNKTLETTHPLVSIIIPTYNHGKYLHDALSSVFADSYSPKEVIVVNDGSTDNTAEIAASFPHLQYIYQKNQGVAVARNTGVRAAKGKYIAFLDSDDIWMAGRIKRTIDYFLKHPDVEYVLAQQKMFLEKDYPKPAHIEQAWLEKPIDTSGSGVLTVRRSCFEKIGLFNPDYQIGEDTEWFLRANEANILVGRMDFVAIKRRIHGANLTVAQVKEARFSLFKMMKESIERKKGAASKNS
ncbi:MAG: glycosyltransferase family 2 protein [Bacteroidetes bacterium]|nr:MAG: glycosyltransferase family 2 protein [Bacteroidota bacterium]